MTAKSKASKPITNTDGARLSVGEEAFHIALPSRAEEKAANAPLPETAIWKAQDIQTGQDPTGQVIFSAGGENPPPPALQFEAYVRYDIPGGSPFSQIDNLGVNLLNAGDLNFFDITDWEWTLTNNTDGTSVSYAWDFSSNNSLGDLLHNPNSSTFAVLIVPYTFLGYDSPGGSSGGFEELTLIGVHVPTGATGSVTFTYDDGVGP